jgi:hypothetical protein
MNSCAPYVKNNDLTCFTMVQLKQIAKNYNATINSPKNIIKMHRTKEALWNAIEKKLQFHCPSDEKCWLNFGTTKNAHSRFRPDMPKSWVDNPREWLSNIDIQKVMQQYQKKTFKFVGVFPTDYDYKLSMNECVAEELCNLDIKQLKKDKVTELGIIFNTDPHYASGSHWVAVYVNIINSKKNGKFGFYYYDSNAEQPSKYIHRLYDSIKTQLPKIQQDIFTMRTNDVKHQFKNTECGMFSMDFIINMLNKKNTFDQIIHQKIDDDIVFKKRKIFFRR